MTDPLFCNTPGGPPCGASPFTLDAPKALALSGIPVGALAGALLWKEHRVVGGVLGALGGAILTNALTIAIFKSHQWRIG